MLTEDELIEKTDLAISELVYDKTELKKAYNYYDGIRDAELFRYLEDNFGLSNPTSVEFIPLIRKHIDALIGEYLGTPVIPKVSCKDSKTISKITREKEIYIYNQVRDFLLDRLQNKLLESLQTQQGIIDTAVQKEVKELEEDLDRNFISLFEIAAQNVLEYLMQSRSVDLTNKLKILLLDLLITGYTFFKVKKTPGGQNVEIEVLNPLNTFIEKNPDSVYVKDSYRAVVRKWMTKSLILNKYGKHLKQSDISDLKNDEEARFFDDSTYYVRSISDQGLPLTDGILAGIEATLGYPGGNCHSNHLFKFIPVYEVEWIETDNKFVQQRYTTVRIGQEIYILNGKDNDVIRSIDDPTKCSLSVNGVYFLNRNNEPYSLMLACANLLDKYDLLHFYRDNLIANSGTTGDWIDESLIPLNLGVKWPERLQKWLAYKKQGIALIDTAQEGRAASGQAPINTIFNGYDDTVKVLAIQAIQLAIQSVEETASSITGVFRERLNGIEQRDAVTNIKQGAANSFIITKLYYHLMDLATNEILLDCLNLAKIVYKKGLTGTLILGDKYLKIFTALPEHFTISDFDIHITTTTNILQDIEYVKQIIPEFIKSGAFAPEVIFEALTSKGLSDLKYKVSKAMEKLKKENNLMMELQKNLEEALQQLLLMLKELQKSLSKIELLNEAKLLLEQQKINMQTKIEMFKALTDRTFKEATAEQDKRRTDIELALLYDGNPYNDEVKNI